MAVKVKAATKAFRSLINLRIECIMLRRNYSSSCYQEGHPRNSHKQRALYNHRWSTVSWLCTCRSCTDSSVLLAKHPTSSTLRHNTSSCQYMDWAGNSTYYAEGCCSWGAWPTEHCCQYTTY